MARKRVQSSPRSKIPTETRPQGRLKKRASDEADVTESQQMLALGSLLKKSRGEDKETQQLRTKVARDQGTLRALIHQRLHRAETERTRRSGDIANIMSTAFVGPTSNPRCPAYPGTAIAINPVFASAAGMISTSRGLLKEYDKMEEMVGTAAGEDSQPNTNIWQKDAEETKRLLDLGHRKAKRDVKKVLGMKGGDEMAGGDEDVSGKLTKTELDYGLRDTLGYAERGVKRMLKGLPSDIEMNG